MAVEYAIPPHKEGWVPPPPENVRWSTDVRDFLKRALAGDKTPPQFRDVCFGVGPIELKVEKGK
jgi:hypothetical protein